MNPVQEPIKILMYCDESGMLHSHSRKRYFCIGGYFCFQEDGVQISTSFKRTMKHLKQKRGMQKSDELKTHVMTPEEKIKLIHSLQGNPGFFGFAIILDKWALKKPVEKESIFFNFLIRQIAERIILEFVRQNCRGRDVIVDLYLDNRNVSVGRLKSLEDYLNTEFMFESITFRTTYCNSNRIYSIQAADLIANTCYMNHCLPKIVSEVTAIMQNTQFTVINYPWFQRIRFIPKKKNRDTHAAV